MPDAGDSTALTMRVWVSGSEAGATGPVDELAAHPRPQSRAGIVESLERWVVPDPLPGLRQSPHEIHIFADPQAAVEPSPESVGTCDQAGTWDPGHGRSGTNHAWPFPQSERRRRFFIALKPAGPVRYGTAAHVGSDHRDARIGEVGTEPEERVGGHDNVGVDERNIRRRDPGGAAVPGCGWSDVVIEPNWVGAVA